MALEWVSKDERIHRLYEVLPDGTRHLLSVMRYGDPRNRDTIMSCEEILVQHLDSDVINSMPLDEAKRYVETLWRLSA